MNSTKKLRVMIIEDDTFLGGMMDKKLIDAGFELDYSKDANEALSKINEFKPEIITLDIILPKMNGFEFLKKIKENKDTKNIPVLILSNLGSREEIQQGMEAGAEDYVVKSNTTLEEVINRINKIAEKYSLV